MGEPLPEPRSVPLPWTWVTVFGTFILAGALGLLILMTVLTGPVGILTSPDEVLARVYGSDLDVATAWPKFPHQRLPLTSLAPPAEATELEEAIAHYRELAHVWGPRQSAKVTLVVLLAEAGKLDEAQSELKRVPNDASVEAVRAAYWNEPLPKKLPEVMNVGPTWVADRVWKRLAERKGNAELAQAAAEAPVERGTRILQRLVPVERLFIIVCLIGLGCAIYWGVRGFKVVPVSGAMAVAPWPVGRAFAILVRAGVAGLVICIPLFIGMILGLSWVIVVADFVLYLPLLWLAHRYLYQPWGLSLVRALGLRVASWRKMIYSTFALTTVEQIIGMGVMVLATAIGFSFSSLESILEDGVVGGQFDLVVIFIGAVILAPVLEEIMFRGILFPSLRARMGMWPAAILSSFIFGAIHLYSPPATVAITLGGIASCVAYERTRSLWPCILAHAANNALAMASMVILYR